MSDLVERLREISNSDGVQFEAASRIEALEAALRQARVALIASDRDSDYEIVDAINDLLNDTPEKQK